MRDRLIELLGLRFPIIAINAMGSYDTIGERALMRSTREKLADYLIANGVTVQEWISVKDRLPKGGAIVLCNTDYFVEVLQWDERADMWVDNYRSYRKNYVTHWMPLPPAPKGE